VFEPAGVFRRIVILLDGLVEDFHAVLRSEVRHVGHVVEILPHHDGLEANGVAQRVFGA
jgi:hypothetical protein